MGVFALSYNRGMSTLSKGKIDKKFKEIQDRFDIGVEKIFDEYNQSVRKILKKMDGRKLAELRHTLKQ